LNSMCKVPQQEKTNTTDCGVFVCMYCNFILNDCELDFSQKDITNGNWQEKMILSIMLVKPRKNKDSNNNDKVTISGIQMAGTQNRKI
jgi:hypothetical protein